MAFLKCSWSSSQVVQAERTAATQASLEKDDLMAAALARETRKRERAEAGEPELDEEEEAGGAAPTGQRGNLTLQKVGSQGSRSTL